LAAASRCVAVVSVPSERRLKAGTVESGRLACATELPGNCGLPRNVHTEEEKQNIDIRAGPIALLVNLQIFGLKKWWPHYIYIANIISPKLRRD
jgi:hypothetical protein